MKKPSSDGMDPFAENPTELPPAWIAPDPDLRAPLAAAEQIGAQVGRFKLLEKIGEGGFGVVYVAEQKVPIRRRVALKIIKLGMDTRSVVARFEAERQALAMMDHPNIAKVLDAGATDTGRPYFVMELVRGVPITEYCDQNNSTPAERLRLFVQVCQAIQHAHQKGIIHRDIKPSNILVTLHDGVPIPKVIDFGIAKATQGDLTEKTVYTQFQQFVGTPAYMSPEQAEMSGLDVDTRSDIYSLGVLLYELLTGLTPFDAKELMKAGVDEMRRTIRQIDPPRPSNRLSGMSGADSTSTAKRRGMEAHRLVTLLRGDLDWIVMKCLEKDRTRRYETANGLAVDIQRHLSNEPIAARPPSAMYRVRKFVRRNKLAVIAAAAVALAMLGGLGLATVGFFRASTERDRAQAATALADANFRQARAAVEDLLQLSDKKLKDLPGMQPLRLELMKAAIDRYEPFLATPMADPTPRAELARLYAGAGLLTSESSWTKTFDANVMSYFAKAQTIQEQLLKEHPGDRSLLSDLGWTLILESWAPHVVPPPPETTGMAAVTLFRKLAADDPSDPFARDDEVWASYIYARLHKDLSDPAVRAISDEGVAIGEQLVAEYPASAEFRRELTNALVANARGKYSASPTPQEAKNTLAVFHRILGMREAILADLLANRPEALLPLRPEQSQARIVYPSVLFAECDVGWSYFLGADACGALHDWHDLANLCSQGTVIWKDVVEHNPAVTEFGASLAHLFQVRIDAAESDNERGSVAAWSRDAVEFWKRQIELHPDVPTLRKFADDAAKQDVEVAAWLGKPPATGP